MGGFRYICSECGKEFISPYKKEHQLTFCSPGCSKKWHTLPIEYHMFRWLNTVHYRSPTNLGMFGRIKNISEKHKKLISLAKRTPFKKDPIIVPDIVMPKEISGDTCCDVLKSHHTSLKDDPERLTTTFIKNLSNCGCERKPRKTRRKKNG